MVAVTQGMVVVNTDRGTVDFCSFAAGDFGPPPTPIGKCARIGAVGASAAGYVVTPTANDAFIYNKTTGYIFQCATVLAGAPGDAFGACHAAANASAM
jgi:hypothetical protein